MNVLGMSGSLRRASFNTALLHACSQLAPEDVSLTVHDLRDLPLFDQDVEEQGDPPAVAALKDAIDRADALLLASPEYNGGITGVLKNAIDWASRKGISRERAALAGKRVCIVGASPGMTGTVRAQDALRLVLRRAGAIVEPQGEVLVFQAHTKIIDGALVDARTSRATCKPFSRLHAGSDQLTRDIIMTIDLAVIGGSGLYNFPGLENMARRRVDTPYGPTSGDVVIGRFAGQTLAFLARHGESHSLPPHRVNYRANLWALHSLGARRVVGVNAVGGIRADMGPRVIVVPDQIIDYTHGRITSFCDMEGAEVRHIDFSEPYTASLRQSLVTAAASAGIDVIDGGCYGATQGPRLETRAEIARLKRDGCDLVGMTGMPEAALARELELDYACLALVANFAAGCGDEAEISIEEIFAHLAAATAEVPRLLAAMLAG